MPDANFNEVFALTVDTAQFQAGLEELQKLYADFIAKLGDQAAGVIGVSVYQGIAQELSKLSDEVAAFNAENQKVAQDALTAVTGSLTQIDAKEEELAQKRAARAAKAAQEIADAKAVQGGDGTGNIPPGAGRDIATEQQGLVDQHNAKQEEQFADELASRKQMLSEVGELSDAYDAKRQVAEEKAQAQAQKADQQTIANFQKEDAAYTASEQKKADAADRAAAKQQAAEEAQAQRQMKMAEDINIVSQGMEDQYAAKQEAAREKAQAQSEKADQQTIANFQKENEAYERAQSQRVRPGEENEAQIYTAQAAAIEENARRQAAADAERAAANKGILDGIEKQAIGIAKIYVIWTAVQAVLDAIASAIKAPFEAFADGFRYLEQIEQEADKLAGVLAANVKFSADMGENFAIASQQANLVAVALRQLSAQINVPLDQLSRTFSAIVDAGGASTVATMRDLVTLTQDFALSFQAAGRSATSMRSLVSQLPQLFEGNVKSTQAIAEALGLSGDQLTKMVASAKVNHDLTEQLAPILASLNAGAAQLGDSYERQAAALKQNVAALEGSAAKPLFEELKQILADINSYLVSSGAELARWAGLFGSAVADAVKMSAEFAKGSASAEDVSGAVATMAQTFGSLVVHATQFAQQLLLAAKYVNEISKASPLDFIENPFSNKNKTPPGQAIADQMAKLEEDLKNWDANFAVKTSEVMQANDNHRMLAPTDPLSTGVTDKGNRPNLTKVPDTAAKDEKEELQNRLADIKAFYAVYTEAIKEGEAAGTESRRAGAEAITQIDAIEKAAMNAAIDTFEANIRKRVTDTTKQNELIKVAETERIKLTASIDQATSGAVGGGDKEALEVQTANRRAALAQQKADVTAEAQYEAVLARAGLETALQALDAKIAAEKTAHDNEIAALKADLPTDTRSVTYAAITNQIKAIDNAYTAQTRLNSLERIQVIRAEEASFRQHANTMRELNLQLTAVQAETANSLSSNPDRTGAIQYQAEQTALDLKTQALQKQLEINEATHKTQEENNKIIEQLKQMEVEQAKLIQSRLAQIGSSGDNPVSIATAQQKFIGSKTDDAQAALQQAELQALQEANDTGKITNATLDRIDAATKRIADLTALSASGGGQGAAAIMGSGAVKQFFGGVNVSQIFDPTTKAANVAALSLTAFGDGLKTVVGIIGQVEQGLKQGGTLGGIGAGVSSVAGIAGSIAGGLSSIPGIGSLVGGAVGALGSIFSVMGSLFTAAARKVAQDISNSFKATVQAYQDGSASLVATLTAVIQERANAISQLSGMKGGQDQLNQLLPQLDQEISSLTQQQHTIITNFEQANTALQLHSDALSQVVTQWQQINNQVTEYINAGGSAAIAAQYLSTSLQNIQTTAQNSLDQANQQAISDALQLNSLLQQKVDLEAQYQQQVFSLTTQDSIERRQDSAVANGIQLAAIQTQHELDLENLNNEISLTQQKVALEGQIFTLAQTTAALNLQSNALTIEALQTQITQWLDLKQIIGSITLGPNGTYTGSGITNQIASLTVNVVVSQPITTASAAQVGNTVANEISARLTNGQSVH